MTIGHNSQALVDQFNTQQEIVKEEQDRRSKKRTDESWLRQFRAHYEQGLIISQMSGTDKDIAKELPISLSEVGKRRRFYENSLFQKASFPCSRWF